MRAELFTAKKKKRKSHENNMGATWKWCCVCTLTIADCSDDTKNDEPHYYTSNVAQQKDEEQTDHH